MSNIGSASFIFEVDDKGTPQIKKISASVAKQMKKMSAQSDKSTKKMATGWSRVKKSMGSGWSKIRSALGSVITKMLALYGAYKLISTAGKFFKESIQYAKEFESSISRLDTALRSTGMGTKGMTQRLVEHAGALQNVVAYDDSVIMETMAMLSTFKLTEKQIKLATKATLDMAAATGQDLVQASILMGKAMVGETGTLSRYGIIIDKTKLAAEGYKAVLDEINIEFGGQAAARAMTYYGALENVKNAYSDLQREIGDVIIKNTTLRALLNVITQDLTGLTNEIKGQKSAYDSLITEGIEKAIDALTILTQVHHVFWAAVNGVLVVVGGLTLAGLKLANVFTYVGQGIAAIMHPLGSTSQRFVDLRADIDNTSAAMGEFTYKLLQDAKKHLEDAKGSGEYFGGVKYRVNELSLALKRAQIDVKDFKKLTVDDVEIPKDEKAGAAGKDSWQVPTDPKQFWGEFASNQQAMTSPKSTWDEYETAFTRLQAMFARIDDVATNTSQKIGASFVALNAGMQNSVARGNTYLQSMAEMGQQTAESLRGGFETIFFNVMKGNFSSIKDLFMDMLNNMLNAFLKVISQMMAQQMMSGIGKVVGSMFGGFGGMLGMANGGVMNGHFMPLRAMAGGGTVNSPTLGLIGEGRYNEAVVPLPDGKSIPVQMNQGKEDIHITIQNVLDAKEVVGKVAQENPHIIVNPVVADYGNRGPMHKVISRGGK